ncbi:prepilin peptidase [Reyranella sp.]|uniref:prepilin peptidase n=1 Tax=Reyranella sp. TaxID=1929291 RepID=UPI003BA93E70
MPDLATLLQTGCLIILAGLLLAAAWHDLRTLHISNRLSIAIMALFCVWALAGLSAGVYSVTDLALAVGCAVGLFLLGAAAFAGGLLGGGDVKLLAGVGLFAGPALVVDLLLVTAVVGGVLGAAVLAGVPLGPVGGQGEATLRERLRGRLPYGPAIAAGGLWVATQLAIG